MKYANQILHSDVYPYEVIRKVSETTLEIRRMNATELEWDKEVYSGGFFAHVANQNDQKWEITPNPNASIIRIRKRKNGKWYDANGMKYQLDTEPDRFHDYNF